MPSTDSQVGRGINGMADTSFEYQFSKMALGKYAAFVKNNTFTK